MGRRFVIFLISLIGVAQLGVTQDSLVRFSELRFETDSEMFAFREYLANQDVKAATNLLLTSSPGFKSNEPALARINALSSKLKSSGNDSKKPEKRVKAVYDQVHAAFLTKYEMVNRFGEIFTTGNYNCVTATALYALIFDEIGIPYSIQEKPTHVFLVAYPNQQNIVVETTSPLFGYLNFDAKYKESFVNNMKNSKLISAAESSGVSTDELFNKYYFNNEKINLRQLIGLHYMNDALFKADEGMHSEALVQAEKAYFLYPSQRCEYLLAIMSAQVLQSGKLLPLEKILLIAKTSRYQNQGITKEMIKGEFARINEEVLIKKNDRALYTQCLELFLKNCINDKELVAEIKYFYNYELGRINHNQGNYLQAKQYFGRAMEQQPNNVELTGIYFSTLVLSMRNMKDELAILDSIQAQKKRFAILSQNNNFNSLYAMAILGASAVKTEKGDVATGEGLIQEFEEMLKTNSDLVRDENKIGMAYSRLLTYYFKRGQKEKAKTYLKRGLELAPDSFELRTRQQMLNY